jgi:hypothetical protein
MEITKKLLMEFREDFKTAVADLEAKYGCAISLGSISYRPTNFTGKIEVVTSDGDTSAEEAMFNTYCDRFGLKPHHYQCVFKLRGNDYRLTGIKVRNRKYPIIATNVKNGTSYKLPKSTVEKILLTSFVGNI